MGGRVSSEGLEDMFTKKMASKCDSGNEYEFPDRTEMTARAITATGVCTVTSPKLFRLANLTCTPTPYSKLERETNINNFAC